MFENFSGLSIQGKCFKSQEDLVFLNENHRFCLVYGKNGSGKSTISQAFNAIKNDYKNFSTLKVIDKDRQDITITEDEKKQIFVFNEEYINKKVEIKDDGLDVIVLLGDVVDLDKKLKKIDKISNIIKTRSDQYKKEFEKYENSQNTDNPEKYKNEIEKILIDKFTKRWKEIQGRERAPSNIHAFDTAINLIHNYQNEQFDNYELENTFNNKLKLYKEIKSNFYFINNIKYLEFNDINELLLYEVKQTELTPNEKQIKQVILDDKITQNIMKSDRDICPYCFQKLTDEYKKQILSSFENIFNPDIKNHKIELEKKKVQAQNLLSDLNILQEMQILDENLLKEISSQIKQYEETINQKIDKKIKNPFMSFKFDENFNNFVTSINKKLEQLEQKRQNFQEQKKQANTLKNELNELNNKLAYNEIKANFKDYEEKSKIKDKLEQKNTRNNRRLECIKTKQAHLNAQKEQINIAQDKINQHLKYIFFKKGRLELSEPNSQKQYTLKSNGDSVKAKDVSTGERNAIALSYFFTEIFSREDEKYFYKKPKFIVIDDPVSSFDFENKVGIMSFLNYQIKEIINNCNESKIIVLTHDLMSAFDIQKIISSLPQININNKNEVIFIQKELKNHELIDFGRKYSEYKTLLNEIYEYAINPNQMNSNANIGNAMRKVLEAFGTFNYQCGIEDIATDQDIISKLQPDQKKYFQNLMYRLILNGESHTQNKTKSIDFFSHIDEIEKQKTAQDILSLLCLLDEVHLKKYFKDDSKINHIKSNWVIQCKL